ncbi:MAG: copper oxidase, partial [Synechococcaceae bacterium WB9_4xB_025]|nr:copper oxidase [Synechococcaceae bacterium WB9_4xB_025]
ITTQSSAGTQQFTIQLNAGHFIATSEPGTKGNSEGSQSHHGGTGSTSDQIFNLRHDSIPIQLVEQLALPDNVEAVTPVIAGSRGIGATIVGDRLVVAQGNGANGNSSTGNTLVNTSQQLVLDSKDLLKVSRDDLTGIVTSSLNSTFSAGQLRERNQLTALTYQAYAGGSLWPSGQAGLAAAVLGQGQTAAELAETLLTQPGYSSDVENYYGGSLSDLSVDLIVNGATRSLYQRQATGSELRFWKGQVQDGLDQTLLPLAILQNTSGKDRYRVGLLSAAAAWTQLQWGTTANIAGSFGQGLQADTGRANKLDQQLAGIGGLDSWRDAQQAFNAYTDTALNQLDGTPVSKSGFF